MSQYTFPQLLMVPGDPAHFTGAVRLGEIATSTDDRRVRVHKVEFSPTSRTNWHRHTAEQVLLILEGVCVLKSSGKTAMYLRSGESTSIPANTRHWHGSAAEGSMIHLALNLGGDTQWLEAVAATEYKSALAEARRVARARGRVADDGTKRASVSAVLRKYYIRSVERALGRCPSDRAG